ncbi:MAG: nucleotidyltransferase [Lachnospiraceae bacterium]|nr:nucleotidyltransferase [Lachnospiraceae bacterium]
MKIVGLITEYNPFHNGHQYHIEASKKITGADHVVVVMSGDYVQRGTPAIMPKALRAEMALKSGASAVFELPVCYATGSAELFALGATALLNDFRCMDYLVFGSECNDLKKLGELADILQNEPEEFKKLLQQELKEGLTFPAARNNAIAGLVAHKDYTAILKEPNNILGIEYLKALQALESPIEPFSIQRKGSNYHDTELTAQFSSATAIRSLLAYASSAYSTYPEGESFMNTPISNILNELDQQVPECCLGLLKDYHEVNYPIYQNDFSLLMKYKLINKTPKDLVRYMDVSLELGNRICKQLNNFFNYKQFCQLLKTKDITHTRVNRALLHIMLGIKKQHVNEYRQNGYHFYGRLLGLQKGQDKLISKISKESRVPIITNVSNSEHLNHLGRRMLYHDILASNLYNSVVTDKFKTAFENEYRQGVLKI